MKYTLRQLEVFLAVAHFQNITKAADSLAMSQSAASSALKEIEQQFSMLLFDRIGKRLQINEMGLSIRPHAQSLIARAGELEGLLANKAISGHLKIGATMTIGNYMAVDIMAKFIEQYPGSQVDLDVENTAHITEKIVNFELDIGLVEGELNHADLVIEPWCTDELVIFCSPKHPLASQDELTDEDITSTQWIVREPGSGTRQHFDKAMMGLLPELDIRLELQHTEAIKRAVVANLGVGCLSKIALQEPLKRGDVVALKTANRALKRQFYFIWHQQKYQTLSMHHWLALCRQWVGVK